METIGLIGVGLVGSAIARRLRAADYDVLAFDQRPEQCDALSEIGVRAASSVIEIARGCGCILLSLPTSSDSTAVCQEVVQELSLDSVIIDTTTGHPTDMALLGEEVGGYGRTYVDAPILGSSAEIATGQAVSIEGGSAEALERVEPIIATYSRRVRHVGPCGSASRMKLVVNLVLGLNRAALAEGLAFAQSMNVSPGLALEVLQDSAASSRVMDTKGRKMVDRDFTPQARLRQHLKDVRLINSVAKTRKLTLPFSQLHSELLSQLESLGFGDDDNSAIIRHYDRPQSHHE